MQINIKSLHPKLLILLGLSIIFICLIIINFFSNQFLGAARLDLTANQIFTLSSGSRKVLNNIDEPITLKLFFSKRLAKDNPFFLNFGVRVEEFLKLYKRYSNNKIKLQIIDPVPFTEEEDQAMHYGLQGVPVNNEGTELYFGLVAVNSTTGKEVIPFLQPNREGYLEYDITQLIAKLSKQAFNKIAVLSTLPIDGKVDGKLNDNQNIVHPKNKPWIIWQQINQQFDVEMLDFRSVNQIPREVKVLLLIDPPEELELKVAKAIDQFVLEGGRILLLLNPISEVKQNLLLDQSNQLKLDKNDSSNDANKDVNNKNTKVALKKLLIAWGIDYDPNKIVASKELAKQVRYSHEGKEITSLYPLWIDVTANNLSKNDILTANISRLTFISAGAIAPSVKAKSIFSPLISISSDAMLIDKVEHTKYKSDPISMLKNYNGQASPVNLAARITGEINSIFSDKTISETNIVVIANADFLYDHFWATVQNFLGNQIFIPNSGNGTLILNALDNLTGSDALISIRSKDSYTKGFDKIKEIEIQSQNKFHQTEEALLKRIEETKKKLAAMDQKTLSLQHKKEEEIFKNDLINTRKKLREVRRSLREDIQSLETNIKFFSIMFMPLLIMVSFISYWLMGDKFYKLIGYKKNVEKFK